MNIKDRGKNHYFQMIMFKQKIFFQMVNQNLNILSTNFKCSFVNIHLILLCLFTYQIFIEHIIHDNIENIVMNN